MTIQSDENIANSYKTVQKRTVSRTEYQRNTTKQIELWSLNNPHNHKNPVFMRVTSKFA